MPTASLDETRSAAGNAGRQGAEKVSAEVEKIQSELKKLSARVADMADEGLARAQAHASTAMREADEAVRRNPYSAIATAIGVGLLLGFLLRR